MGVGLALYLCGHALEAEAVSFAGARAPSTRAWCFRCSAPWSWRALRSSAHAYLKAHDDPHRTTTEPRPSAVSACLDRQGPFSADLQCRDMPAAAGCSWRCSPCRRRSRAPDHAIRIARRHADHAIAHQDFDHLLIARVPLFSRRVALRHYPGALEGTVADQLGQRAAVHVRPSSCDRRRPRSPAPAGRRLRHRAGRTPWIARTKHGGVLHRGSSQQDSHLESAASPL